MYDLLSSKENMESSYLIHMSKGKALEMFPMLKSDGLVGAVVYYDGTLSRRITSSTKFTLVQVNTMMLG